MASTIAGVRDRNLLLATVPPDEYERLLPKLQSLSIAADHVLIEPFKPIRHAYFPIYGVVSLLLPVGAARQIEAGMVGNEGLAGVCLALGSDRAPMRAVAQTESHGLRMSAEDFQAEMQRNDSLANAVRRYAQGYLVMLSQGLVCLHAHKIEQRCVRWLLMLHDRVPTDRFQLTHQSLARMLGVRRASVSEVAGRLQSYGLLRYERGVITILDRGGLEKRACECYRIVRRELTRLLAPLIPARPR